MNREGMEIRVSEEFVSLCEYNNELISFVGGISVESNINREWIEIRISEVVSFPAKHTRKQK